MEPTCCCIFAGGHRSVKYVALYHGCKPSPLLPMGPLQFVHSNTTAVRSLTTVAVPEIFRGAYNNNIRFTQKKSREDLTVFNSFIFGWGEMFRVDRCILFELNISGESIYRQLRYWRWLYITCFPQALEISIGLQFAFFCVP